MSLRPGPATSPPSTVAVIGGGITGLSAALDLTKRGHTVQLFESTDSFGGKVAECSFDGQQIPTGPDAFLARRPELVTLAEEVGLETSLTSPAAGNARIYRNGALHPLPANVLGIPATDDVGATGLISPEGTRRAAVQIADSPDAAMVDESVGSLVRRQMGDEVLEFLVDPLLGGINAGDSDRLSVMAGAPQIDSLRQRDPILLRAARQALDETARTATPGRSQPVFRSIEGGLSRLVDKLVHTLEQAPNCTLNTSSTATLERANTAWRVGDHEFDQVISTIPAFAAASMIEPVCPEASSHLRKITYSSVGLTVMSLPPNTLDIEPTISGVLVPRTLGLDVTAVSFASHKWPLLARRGEQLLRISTGRRTNDAWSTLDNDQLVTKIEQDLSEMFGCDVRASNAAVTRWMQALPQYDVDHSTLISNIDAAVADLAGLQLTGAWRTGLGLPACVEAGRIAANAV